MLPKYPPEIPVHALGELNPVVLESLAVPSNGKIVPVGLSSCRTVLFMKYGVFSALLNVLLAGMLLLTVLKSERISSFGVLFSPLCIES